MIHRDIHFENWLLNDNNELKLLDFGIALVIGENTLVKNNFIF